MPIRKEMRQRYPKDWALRSRFVRFYRAGNRCEWCGVHNYSLREDTGAVVVLTAAHVYDKRPEACGLLTLGRHSASGVTSATTLRTGFATQLLEGQIRRPARNRSPLCLDELHTRNSPTGSSPTGATAGPEWQQSGGFQHPPQTRPPAAPRNLNVGSTSRLKF